MKKVIAGGVAVAMLCATAIPTHARERRGYYPHHHRGPGAGVIIGGLGLGALALGGGLYAMQPRPAVPYDAYAYPPVYNPPAPPLCTRYNGLYGFYEQVPCY